MKSRQEICLVKSKQSAKKMVKLSDGTRIIQNRKKQGKKKKERERNKMLKADETIPLLLGKVQTNKKHEWGKEDKKEHSMFCFMSSQV